MSALDDLKTACECCDGIESLTPGSLRNAPGLPALTYRAGTHGSFKSSMLAAISQAEKLTELSTRRDDEFSIALIDSWAVVLDVLTFYQERAANEAYLRTAVQRRSLLELARLIGYELRPGVSASVFLAFELDGSPGSPPEVTVPFGTRAQSLPVKEETPQSFETSAELLARPRWSLLRPRLTFDQTFDESTRLFHIKGVATALKVGDPMLLATGDGGAQSHEFLRVTAVNEQPLLNRTEVRLGSGPAQLAVYQQPLKAFAQIDTSVGFNIGSFVTQSQSQLFSTTSLLTALAQGGFHYAALAEAYVANNSTPPEPPAPGAEGLYALRISASPFGHNAPKWNTTPLNWRFPEDDETVPFSKPWDAPPTPVNEFSQVSKDDDRKVHLERAVDGIDDDDWVVLEDAGGSDIYQVEAHGQESIADFGLSGKSSWLQLKEADEAGLALDELGSYTFRKTTIHTGRNLLQLAELPIDEVPAGSDALELDSEYPDLIPGKKVILFGERLGDLAGVTGAEVIELLDVGIGRFTTLVFKAPLEYGYKRDTVRIYANVVEATHGETRIEALGSGNAGAEFQSFSLRDQRLTHVAAATVSGASTTLEVRVNSILRAETPGFFPLGPKDENFVTKLADDGNTQVLFGDGKRGTRLPTGIENVTAKYRVGIGLEGLVDRERISLLPIKPLGVKGVTNPIASFGAEDPESRDQARTNAPLTVITLDRIVSISDYEYFSRAFAGIGKARAEWVWNGGRRIIHVTIAGIDGAEVTPQTIDNLVTAMNAVRDVRQPLQVDGYDRLFFNVAAKLRITAGYLDDDVLSAAETKLRDEFSFDRRAFGTRVAISDVIATLQNVAGVESVDLDDLAYSGNAGGNTADKFGLPSLGARLDVSAAPAVILPGQLLLIDAAPVALEVIP